MFSTRMERNNNKTTRCDKDDDRRRRRRRHCEIPGKDKFNLYHYT